VTAASASSARRTRDPVPSETRQRREEHATVYWVRPRSSHWAADRGTVQRSDSAADDDEPRECWTQMRTT
jgi:hypothetical protein